MSVLRGINIIARGFKFKFKFKFKARGFDKYSMGISAACKKKERPWDANFKRKGIRKERAVRTFCI